jgi:hypothetical protein
MVYRVIRDATRSPAFVAPLLWAVSLLGALSVCPYQ